MKTTIILALMLCTILSVCTFSYIHYQQEVNHRLTMEKAKIR